MKTRSLQSLVLTFTTVAAVTLLAAKAAGQESSTSTTTATTTPAAAQPAAAPAPAATSPATPQLSYGVAEVVQLAHANVSEDIIVNYVQNSGNGYGLDANQILYLKQQGVSDRVVNAMLAQRSRVAAQATPPGNSDTANAPTATVVAQPTTYVQPASSSTVYVIPDTQTYDYYAYYYHPYYYPYYGYYGWPAVSFSFGYGGYYGGYRGGWHGGGGWHYSGGGHGGGGWHGGGHR